MSSLTSTTPDVTPLPEDVDEVRSALSGGLFEPPEPKKKKKKAGKEWERQVRDAVRTSGLFSIGLDDIGQQTFVPGMPRRVPKRPGDRVVCYRGAFLLLEAKECELNVLVRDRFSADCEEALYAVTRDQGLAIVAIRHRQANGRNWEAWLVHYADLMDAIRQTGTKRLRLDKGVPACFVPMTRQSFDGERHWDVRTALETLIAQGAPRCYHLDPEQELGRRAKAEAKKIKAKADREQQATAKRPKEDPPF
jgi:hypothetical protein